jgi:hypothetical protein
LPAAETIMTSTSAPRLTISAHASSRRATFAKRIFGRPALRGRRWNRQIGEWFGVTSSNGTPQKRRKDTKSRAASSALEFDRGHLRRSGVDSSIASGGLTRVPSDEPRNPRNKAANALHSNVSAIPSSPLPLRESLFTNAAASEGWVKLRLGIGDSRPRDTPENHASAGFAKDP